jgi:hypothetical protein
MTTIRLKTCDHKWCENEFPEHYFANECSDIHLPRGLKWARPMLWKLKDMRRRLRKAVSCLRVGSIA